MRHPAFSVPDSASQFLSSCDAAIEQELVKRYREDYELRHLRLGHVVSGRRPPIQSPRHLLRVTRFALAAHFGHLSLTERNFVPQIGQRYTFLLRIREP